MDILTILGFALGLSAVYMVMLHGQVVHLLFNVDAAVLVFGGTFGATMIAFPWKSLKHVFPAFKIVIFPHKYPGFNELLSKLIKLISLAKRSGPAGLAGAVDGIKDDFLKRSLNMLIEGVEPDIVKQSMRQEILSIQQRHQKTASVFRTMATFSPIFGLLGTLIGVVQVLRNLTDPESMGASMAIAVTTTFYGIFGANFLFLPVAIKLSEYSEEEILHKELILESVSSIINNEVPVVASLRLEAYFSQRLKEQKGTKIV